MPIFWEEFTWEAFATLAAGGAAVVGAVVVGLKQANIQKRQADIAERQVKLAELTLRKDLFDRRFAVYEATRAYLGEITAYADQPRNRETDYNYLVAMDQSRFLFPPAVYEGLRAIWKDTSAFFALKKVMKATYEQHGHYGEGNPEKEYEFMTRFADQQTSLADLFGDDLVLTDIQEHPTNK